MDAATVPDLAEVIWRRRLPLAAVTIAAGILTVFVTWLSVPRHYTATARVLYESKLSGSSGQALLRPGVEERGPMMIAVLRSRTFAFRMVDKYDLVSRFEAEDRLKAADEFRQLLRANTHAGGVLEVKLKLAGSPRGIIEHGEDEQTAELAAAIINHLLTDLRSYLEESDFRENQRQLQTIEAALAEAEAAYRETIDKIITFQEESGIISPEAQVRAIYNGLSQADKMLAESRADLRSAETAYEMAAANEDSARALAETQSPAVQTLLARLYENQVEFTNAITVGKKLPSHPDVQQLQTSIDEIKRQLEEQIDLQDAALAVKVAVSRERLKAVEHIRAQLTSKLPRLTSGSVVHEDLLNELELQAKRRITLFEQLERAKIGAEGEKIIFTILDPPMPPTDRSGPSTILNCLGAMIAAFALGLVVFYYADVTRPQLQGAALKGPDN